MSSTLTVWAQEELLPSGAYGTTIHGGIKAGESKAYHLSAEEGQVIKASLSTRDVPKGAVLELRDSEGESLLADIERLTSVRSLDLVFPKDDTYLLHIKAGEKSCSYVLEVTLEDPPPPKIRTRGDKIEMESPAPTPSSSPSLFPEE